MSNFDHFNVKGTKVEVNVSEWNNESAAIGKLHVVWVVVEGIPDEMKGYQALFEVGSNLGVVMEVDMPTITSKDVVRMKIGMMDLKQLPLRLMLSTPEALLYEAIFTLEKVVEVGWLKGKQMEGKKTQVKEDAEHKGSLTEKKKGDMHGLKEAEASLGKDKGRGESSQIQYYTPAKIELLAEEDKKKAIKIMQDREIAMAIQEKEEKEQHKVLKRGLETRGESSNKEIMAVESKDESLPMIKVGQNQQMGSIKEGMEEDEEGKVHLGDSEELFESQESENNFAKSIGVVLTEEEGGSQEEERRASKRFKDREEKKSLEMAIDRKEARNAFVNKGQDLIPCSIDDSNVSLLDLANLIGVSLGCSIEAVDTNMKLINDLEEARVKLFLKEQQKVGKDEPIENKKGDDNFQDDLFNFLDETDCESNNSELDWAESLLLHSQSGGGKKKNKKGNLAIVKVTPRVNKRKPGKNTKKKKMKGIIWNIRGMKK